MHQPTIDPLPVPPLPPPSRLQHSSLAPCANSLTDLPLCSRFSCCYRGVHCCVRWETTETVSHGDNTAAAYCSGCGCLRKQGGLRSFAAAQQQQPIRKTSCLLRERVKPANRLLIGKPVGRGSVMATTPGNKDRVPETVSIQQTASTKQHVLLLGVPSSSFAPRCVT